MNPVIRAQWTEALRSNRYSQGRSALRSADDRYCCLGVLCDLHQRAMGAAGWKADRKRPADPYQYEGNTFNLTAPVWEWANLGSDATERLIYLNDDKNADFARIADWIEENL